MPIRPATAGIVRPPWSATLLLAAGLAVGACIHAPAAQAAYGSGVCRAPDLGAPCAMGGSATLGSAEPAPGFGLGNPVHLASGNKYQLDVDLPPNTSAPGLELIRHYNGLSIQSGPLGRNWAFSYDTRLLQRGDDWELRQADGSRRKVATPLPSESGFIVSQPGGRKLSFDAHGRLLRIRSGKTTLVRIERHAGPHALAGRIHRVENAAGHALEFHYGRQHGQMLLVAVDTPAGRFHYHYNLPDPDSGHRSPRLAVVIRPDGMQRLYHYESEHQNGNPYALTGISVQTADRATHRLATWEYDRYSRVVGLRQHGRHMPALHIDYLRGPSGERTGVTRVRSDNGQQRIIRFQRAGGGYRLLSRSDTSHDTAPAPVTYDAAGRLAAIDGLRLQRDPLGTLTGLLVSEPGWPGLTFERHRQSGRHAWHTPATGRATLFADRAGRPIRLAYAGGDDVRLLHDTQGRPTEIKRLAGDPPRQAVTRLQWRGRQLQRIEHPNETEARRHDAQGRITRRSVLRPAPPGAAAARFEEAFEHDAAGRLVRHYLPEGGTLHYAWREDRAQAAALEALHWEDAQGRMHPVVTSTAGRPGYRYGNGLELFTGIRAGGHADFLHLADGKQSLWRQTRRYDETGRVLQDRHAFPLAGHHDRLDYTYDNRARLLGARHHQPGGALLWWYAWQPDGRLAARRRQSHTRVPDIRRNPAGLPVSSGPYALRYGPGRRLETVSLQGSGQIVAQYRHNAFGHRIVKQAAGETVHYLYRHDRLVAEARSPGENTPPVVSRRYLHAGATPVGMIDYPPGGPPRLYAVHADLSGAPRMITDTGRRLRWLASYSPTGQAERVAGDLRFALRLPGQYADPETGWHDNLLRTYVPALGQYLEPDPLGPRPGSDIYGYAAQQPWRYADPHGLLLFAFDGTRYSADSMSNAWLLAQAYRDGAAHYHSGPGNSLFLDWDAVVAWRAGRILENQWQALLTTLEHQPAGAVTPIDIVGFSRGAALARHFGNRIAQHTHDGSFSVDDPMRGRVVACVDLRFMGLFDTVAQFGIGGSHNHLYDFGVNEMWSWVSHAVALHEHRWAFPLTSADAGGAGNVVEAAFIGAHADIGGGLALHDAASSSGAAAAPGADLAKVALGWMHWQALAASVDFDALAAPDSTIGNPLLRDMRSATARSLMAGDRSVASPSGATRHPYQDDDPRFGRQTREQVEAFIDRYPDWRSQAGETVGRVDMTGYAHWLEETLGWSPQ